MDRVHVAVAAGSSRVPGRELTSYAEGRGAPVASAVSTSRQICSPDISPLAQRQPSAGATNLRMLSMA
jgi:hypothetical protein